MVKLYIPPSFYSDPIYPAGVSGSDCAATSLADDCQGVQVQKHVRLL